MKIVKIEDGVLLIYPDIFTDNRGEFFESFSKHDIDFNIVQTNRSISKQKHTIRGLHYQISPMAQAKLITVLSGSIIDVIVDIRENSKTYGQHWKFELHSKDRISLLVPDGFAHGFCTLEDNTEVMYYVNNYYSKKHESGILWNSLDIIWPTEFPIMSDKDKLLPSFEKRKL
jgi:dTDP-4-dehydrorhamnose 3,5-epimerase